MCGFAGALDLSRSTPDEELADLATAMAETLRHRGPDDGATWTDQQAGVALGFRRLSVIDLTSEGAQPMRSSNGRYVLAFNGEVYNFLELRSELEGKGVRFRGHSDTEVLLEALSAWGIGSILPRLNGMFAFALWDRETRTLSLARDRFGEKPLFCGAINGHFFFTSELKALHRHPAFRPSVDRDAIVSFLRFGYVPAPRSIYRGISKLPPGTYVEVSHDGHGAPVPYWSLDHLVEARRQGAGGGASESEVLEEMDAVLLDAVRLRRIADVPLGGLLSGGVDSSLVVAMLQALSDRPIQTFNIGFEDPEFDESAHARAVAQHIGSDHHELVVTPKDALDLVPHLPSIYDEPFADSSQLPTVLVSQFARREVTVALSGDGGDELFGGYARYLSGGTLRRLSRLPAPLRRSAARALSRVPDRAWDSLSEVIPSRMRLSRPISKVAKLSRALGGETPVDMYRLAMSQWLDPGALVLGGSETDDPFALASEHGASLDFPETMMLLDTGSYLPGDILAKVDRASMASSLEIRVPLLDHRVAELAWGMPSGMRIRGSVGKWALRQVLYRYVPAELVERPKMGFGVPLADWLRGPLKGWGEELLSPRRLHDQGLLDPAPVMAAWEAHQSGRAERQDELWAVLVLQAWLDEYHGGSVLG